MYRNYLASRADRRLVAAEMPIGDPVSGPAYGERLDVGGVVGGLIGADSASDAAEAQEAGVNSANAISRSQYQQNRIDNLPYQLNGVAGNNQLAYLLGLSTTPGNAQPSLANAQLIDATGGYNPYLYQNNEAYRNAWNRLSQEHYDRFGQNWNPGSNLTSVEQALRSALAPQIAKEKAEAAANANNYKTDPAYGSLTRKFSQSDLDNDVVYNTGLQFGLDQGNQAINRQAAASGNMLSGATLKALTRYGNDYGTTKANDAYNRYTNDQNNLYNRLAGLSSSGQVATNQINAAGQNYASTVGNNLIGLGNARGASAIAQGNAYGDIGNILGGAFGNSSLGKSALSFLGL